jgi:hypothetical protein
LKQCIELLNHLCMLVRTDLSKLMRAKLVALITIDVRLPVRFASPPPLRPAPERALQSSFDGVAPLKNASRATAFERLAVRRVRITSPVVVGRSQVHARDIVERLVIEKIRSENDFAWQMQADSATHPHPLPPPPPPPPPPTRSPGPTKWPRNFLGCAKVSLHRRSFRHVRLAYLAPPRLVRASAPQRQPNSAQRSHASGKGRR